MFGLFNKSKIKPLLKINTIDDIGEFELSEYSTDQLFSRLKHFTDNEKSFQMWIERLSRPLLESNHTKLIFFILQVYPNLVKNLEFMNNFSRHILKYGNKTIYLEFVKTFGTFKYFFKHDLFYFSDLIKNGIVERRFWFLADEFEFADGVDDFEYQYNLIFHQVSIHYALDKSIVSDIDFIRFMEKIRKHPKVSERSIFVLNQPDRSADFDLHLLFVNPAIHDIFLF